MSTTSSAAAADGTGLVPERPGGLHDPRAGATGREIAQQPAMWRQVAADLAARREVVEAFLAPLLARDDLRIVLTGAGTSAFVGELLAPALTRLLHRRVEAVATTDVVSNPGEVFAERRADAMATKRIAKGKDFGPAVESGDAVFVECSADANVGQPGGPSLDNPDQWRKANPSYPARTPHESMLRMRKQLASDDSWRREALGVWDDDSTASLISAAEWDDKEMLSPAPEPEVEVYAVRFAVDGSRVALAGGVRPADGPVWVEPIADEPMGLGTTWLVDWLAARWRESALIVIDGKAGASVLVDGLLSAGVLARWIVTPDTETVIAAHASFLEAVRTKSLRHSRQPGVTKEIARATKRKVGTAGGWAWDSMDDNTDVTLLEAVTWAHWAATVAKVRRRGRTTRSRRGVVLS